ncbi:MAG TPA: MBL fold metallo-hydrolase [Edaphobacter sp.]
MLGRALLALLLMSTVAVCHSETRVTILNDAFGRRADLTKDWGYSALVEYEGKRILFDTGGNIAIFRSNVEKMHVDLRHLDMVVVSHAHGDHTSGLRYVLDLNPGVALFVPDDVTFRGNPKAPPFLKTHPEPALEKDHRYYDGAPYESLTGGWKAYSDTKLTVVKGAVTPLPGVRLISLVSDKPAFKGLVEISMVLDTPKGPVVFAGCSHTGIENIAASTTEGAPSKNIYMLFGGLHLLEDSEEQVNATLDVLEKDYHIQRMAVGHCTGEHVFLLIRKRWKKNDDFAGLGETLVI